MYVQGLRLAGMPDWSYHTIFRRALYRLPPRHAQRLAIGLLGNLGSTQPGRALIRFMGHMNPDPVLGFQFRGVDFPSRVGLGAGIDSLAVASDGFDQFGFAFMEYGPITEQACQESHVDFNQGKQVIRLEYPEQNPGLVWLQRSGDTQITTPRFVRFDKSISPDIIRDQLSRENADFAGYIIPFRSWRAATCPPISSDEMQEANRPLILILVPGDMNSETLRELLGEGSIDQTMFDGIFIDGSCSTQREHRIFSHQPLSPSSEFVAKVRQIVGPDRLMIAAGPICTPLQAYQLMVSGAHAVGISSGMVLAGPGLAKRTNELLAQTIFRQEKNNGQPQPTFDDSGHDRASRQSWFWAFCMGISMLGGGLLAMFIALTRVVLPYDELSVGMTREQLIMVNERLLDFMAHDRVTLAGTMLSVGILYTGLAVYGMRRGSHWASQSIIVSAFIGFFTFFLFLGFGYFDPFHAFVTTILFQFLLLTVYAKLPRPSASVRLDLHNDRKWKLGLWGQLMYLIQGAALIVAGCVISWIGITSVFVKEDMEFLCTTPDRLIEANPQLLSLVAHDRATFGGMLVCAGITVSLASLWGFRRGHAWLWWTLFLSGLCGYVSAIGIHVKVGYTSTKHLLPAYGGLAWLCVAAGLCYAFFHDHLANIDAGKKDVT